MGTGASAPRAGATQPTPPSAARDQPAGGGLSERAQALRAYLARPRPQGPVRRNPFRFQEPSAVGAVRGGRALAASRTESDAAASRPEMTLSGIAEETGDGNPVRTAVISTPGQLIFAKEGDRVLARFLVVRIAADAVQLKDDERGEVFTLALK